MVSTPSIRQTKDDITQQFIALLILRVLGVI
jgi:hypothetical protein